LEKNLELENVRLGDNGNSANRRYIIDFYLTQSHIDACV